MEIMGNVAREGVKGTGNVKMGTGSYIMNWDPDMTSYEIRIAPNLGR